MELDLERSRSKQLGSSPRLEQKEKMRTNMAPRIVSPLLVSDLREKGINRKREQQAETKLSSSSDLPCLSVA